MVTLVDCCPAGGVWVWTRDEDEKRTWRLLGIEEGKAQMQVEEEKAS